MHVKREKRERGIYSYLLLMVEQVKDVKRGHGG
jgi:hypothetical protein